MPLYRQPSSPFFWVRFSVGGVKIRRSSGTTDRAAAEEFETRLRADLWRQVKLGERPRYTWAEAVKRWHAEAQGRGKERDLERLKWFDEYLADVALADIDRALIEKLRAVRQAESSGSTANRYLALLRMILRRACSDWEWIERAPTVPMYRLEKAEPRFLTKQQFEKLRRNLPKHLAALAEFSVETGARMRNVTGLRWDQVDLKRRVMIVPASHAKAGETLAVPLSEGALRILRSIAKKKGEPNVFLFRGAPMDDANGKAFKDAAAAAGVPWLRWHDLRHTWASWHIQAGTPKDMVQAMAGWRSYAMVDRYAHLNPAHLMRFVEHGKGIARRARATAKA